MTDEERREAERFIYEHGWTDLDADIAKVSWAAGRESMVFDKIVCNCHACGAEMEVVARQSMLREERTRSAKLIEALRTNVINEREYFEAKPHKALRVLDEVENALAEYEAGK